MKHITSLLMALLCIMPVFAQWHVDEGFEGGLGNLPTGWSYHDDGDGMHWRVINNVGYPHSGANAAFCDNYMPHQNADWLITPQVTIAAGDSLIFFTRSWFSTEDLKVYVSTTGTAIANFNQQILNLQDIGNAYQRVTYDLSSYAVQSIYIGFLWNCENYGILIDDVKIGQPIVAVTELDLPDSFTFMQGQSLEVDFTQYITATDPEMVTLTWQPTQHVSVSAAGNLVTFSSPDWSGTESVTFTVTDSYTNQSDTDTVSIEVTPIPPIDLALLEVIVPREIEFVNVDIIPQVRIKNSGQNNWNSQIGVWFAYYNAAGEELGGEMAYYAGVLDPEEDAVVSFESFVLGAEGTYTASFWLDEADGNPANDSISREFVVYTRVNVGGPDTFGYRFIDSTALGGPEFDWIDISQTGTSSIMYGVDSWAGDDNFSEPIPLGFDFPFYGDTYATAHVDVNGEILLAENNWYDEYPESGWDTDGTIFNYSYPIPGYAAMPALIAVYWDDLKAVQGTGDVYFQTFGEAPNRYTVIQWHQLQFHGGTEPVSLLDFEVILHENGEIVMQYNSTATGQTYTNFYRDNGRSSTVAIQNEDTNAGLCYLREIVQSGNYQGVEPAGNLLFDGLAIRFYSGEDEQAPIITHSPSGNTFNQSPYLTARVADLSPLESVKLYYQSGEGYDSIDGVQTGHAEYYFSFTDLEQGQEIRYYIEAIDIHGNSSTLPASLDDELFGFKILPSHNTSVLLAYSGSQDYQNIELPVYQARLDELNIAYDIYDWEEYETYEIPDVYNTLLVYASSGSANPQNVEMVSKLIDFLDSGTVERPVNLFISSDGWASASHITPNYHPLSLLFDGYLRTFYVPTGSGGGTNGLGGPDVYDYQSGTILCRDNSPIGNPGTEYSVYANSPDCIFTYDAVPDWYKEDVPYPEIGATNAFTFAQGPINGQAYMYNGVCATSVTVPTFNAFYFSFDYSQLNNEADSRELFADLMDWFGVEPSVSDDVVTPHPNRLKGNYPNPFNPSTTIEFSIQNPGKIELSIYNLRGQKVKSLVSDHLGSGLHKVVWNGEDDQGREVGSGIYLVRMQSSGYTMSKKITLIK